MPGLKFSKFLRSRGLCITRSKGLNSQGLKVSGSLCEGHKVCKSQGLKITKWEGPRRSQDVKVTTGDPPGLNVSRSDVVSVCLTLFIVTLSTVEAFWNNYQAVLGAIQICWNTYRLFNVHLKIASYPFPPSPVFHKNISRSTNMSSLHSFCNHFHKIFQITS